MPVGVDALRSEGDARNADAVLGGDRGDEHDGGGQDVGEVDRLGGQHHLAAFDRSDVEDFVDQPEQVDYRPAGSGRRSAGWPGR